MTNDVVFQKANEQILLDIELPMLDNLAPLCPHED